MIFPAFLRRAQKATETRICRRTAEIPIIKSILADFLTDREGFSEAPALGTSSGWLMQRYIAEIISTHSPDIYQADMQIKLFLHRNEND